MTGTVGSPLEDNVQVFSTSSAQLGIEKNKTDMKWWPSLHSNEVLETVKSILPEALQESDGSDKERPLMSSELFTEPANDSYPMEVANTVSPEKSNVVKNAIVSTVVNIAKKGYFLSLRAQFGVLFALRLNGCW